MYNFSNLMNKISKMSVDGSPVPADDVTGDKRSSQLRTYELKVKSLQQENEALVRVGRLVLFTKSFYEICSLNVLLRTEAVCGSNGSH